MTWPWSRRTEQRAGSVTDSVIAELQRRAAGGSSGDPSLCAAVQSAAGIWGRSFAAAAVSPASGTAAAVTPAILHMIGRDLVLQGQSVMQFGVMPGGPMLRRPAEYDLTGSPDPATWAYRLRYIGPSRDSTAAWHRGRRRAYQAERGRTGAALWCVAYPGRGGHRGRAGGAGTGAPAGSGGRQTGYVIPSASRPRVCRMPNHSRALKSDLSKLAGGTRIVPSAGAACWRSARPERRRGLEAPSASD